MPHLLYVSGECLPGDQTFLDVAVAFPLPFEAEGPAQVRVHQCESSHLTWLLAHNPEDRGGAEESLDRGTRASTYSSCSGRQEAEHGRFLGEEPAFSTHLNLDRATLGFCLVQTLLRAWAVECLGLEIGWERGEDCKKQAGVHIVKSPLSVSSK